MSTNSQALRAMRSAFGITKQRCYNTKNAQYALYGGRGIRICQRWLDDFNSFVADMGVRPDGMTLERKDNDGDYSPENCVWATRQQQAVNKRGTVLLTHEGVTRTLVEWSKITGIGYSTLKARVQRLGYSPSEALNKEVKCGARLPSRTYAPLGATGDLGPVHSLEAPRILLSYNDVLRMRQLHKKGKSYTDLAKMFKVSPMTASNAVRALNAYRFIPL